MTPSLRIAGQKVAGQGPELSSLNPADQTVVWRGRLATESQVEQAMQAATAAATDKATGWAGTSSEQRTAIVRRYETILRDAQDELADLISRETGKPLWECQGEVATCIAKVELSIQAAGERRAPLQTMVGEATAEVAYRPLGVVLVLGPYNFPAHLPGGQMIPALLAGNTIVFKPSELTPAVGEWLVDAWQQAGLPAGVVNLLQGGREVAEWAIDSPQLDAVMFTGSLRAGRAIHRRLAGRTDVLLTLEMGGNNPLLVLPDPDGLVADLSQIAGMIVASAYVTAGQRCTCARRLILLDDTWSDALLETLIDRVKRLRVGLPGDDPEPFIGPLISPAAAEGMLAAQRAFAQHGGQVLVELRRDARSQALLHPGLIDMTAAAVSQDEEHFGPLLQVHRVPDFEAAIQLANDTRFGLAAALIGGDAKQFQQFRQQVRAGVINWNRQTTGASGRLPFGGLGDSGNHRPVGYWAIDACSDPVASLLAEGKPNESFDRMQL
ncbi:succinylglutamate-semialdehyde dehydrogenase [Planctomycetaceae bacterium SH139]